MCVTLKSHSFLGQHSIYMRLKYFMERGPVLLVCLVLARFFFSRCCSSNFVHSSSISHLNFNWAMWRRADNMNTIPNSMEKYSRRFTAIITLLRWFTHSVHSILLCVFFLFLPFIFSPARNFWSKKFPPHTQTHISILPNSICMKSGKRSWHVAQIK